MANLLDYVRWRGDLTLQQRPFNIVDNLVLAALSNLDLTEVMAGESATGFVTIRDAAAMLSRHPDAGVPDRRLAFVPRSLLQEMGGSRRFQDATLSAYVDVTDHSTGLQFSALTVGLDNGLTYVSYRGTDATITGWREDFTMSFELVPAQTMAVTYLRHRLEDAPGSLMVGGHSKGGNLAVYAAMKQRPKDQERIAAVYNNDGPGFSPEVADEPALNRIADRITKIVPEFAVIGRLFDNLVPSNIVASSGRGFLQHDIMTWQVEGTALDLCPTQSPKAAILNRAIDTWLEGATNSDRRDFTDALFGSLSAGGAILLQDVPSAGSGSFESVIFSFIRSRTKARRSLRVGTGAAVQALTSADYSGLLQQKDTIRALALVSTGLYFMIVPDLAVQVLGAFALLVICSYLAFRLNRYFRHFHVAHSLRWWWFVVIGVVLTGIVIGASQLNAFTVPRNLLLSAILLFYAWNSARKALTMFYSPSRRPVTGSLLGISAIVSLLFGIVVLSTVDRVMPFFVLQLGQYLFVVGLCYPVATMRRRVAAVYSPAALERAVGS